MSPCVTVLLCVHNDRQYVGQAIDSILSQQFDDFELVCIDDASTDGSADVLIAYRDPRIRHFRNEKNLGLTASLNRGLSLARGKYIARMDADDICEMDRLADQTAFLDSHLQVGILGTSRRLIDESGAEITVARAAEDDAAIRWKCLLGNPFAHPTVMLRRSILLEHDLKYDESFRTAQDYELWTRLLIHTRGANLPKPLIRYRLRQGASRTSGPAQLANHDRIALLAIQRLLPGFAISPDEVRELRGRFGGFSVRDPAMDPQDPYWVEFHARMRRALDSM
jgi:glycosyltransferase involved in cell wall biosynthesis